MIKSLFKQSFLIFAVMLLVCGIHGIGYAHNIPGVHFDDDSTSRSISETAAPGTNIGTAVTATDADNNTLTYSLDATGAMFFDIVSTSGQLKTKAGVVLDRITTPTFMVTVAVSDGTLTDTIMVMINVTITPVCDRTEQVRNAIVAAVEGVTDCADVTETHLAAITELSLFDKSITALKAGDFDGLTALTELDLYSNQLSTLDKDLFDELTALTELTLAGNQFSTLDEDVFDGLTALTTLFLDYNQLTTLEADVLEGLTALTWITMDFNQLSTLEADVFDGQTALTWISLANNQLSTLEADVFEGLTALTTLYLDFNQLSTLEADVFEGLTALTTLDLSNNTVDPLPVTVSLEQDGAGKFKATAHTGAPFTMVLPVTVTNGSIDGGATTITISAGSLESNTLTVTRTTGTTAAVTVNIGAPLPGLPSDHDGYALVKSTNLPVTVLSAVSNNAPVFTDGDSTTRSVAENTAAGVNIGNAVAATDVDTGDTLTYTHSGTTDAPNDYEAFDIVSTSGQLQTKAALDFETKNSYQVTITVSDGIDTDTITVTITVTDVVVFTDGISTTRVVPENTLVDETIAVSDAIDTSGAIYTLGGADAGAFDFDSTTGQLTSKTAPDHEEQSRYEVTITFSTDVLTDSIDVEIIVSNVNEAPEFAESSTSRSIVENASAGTVVGAPVRATDPDLNDPLRYTLTGGDTEAFTIVNATGQLETKAPFDYETEDTSYTVTVTATDSEGLSAEITVAITVLNDSSDDPRPPTPDPTPVNNAPTFSDGESTTREVVENTGSNINIGSGVAAMDTDDNDTLEYTLGGLDAASFEINATNGQLITKAPLDHETKDTYTVTVTATDSEGLSAEITVAITVLNDSSDDPRPPTPDPTPVNNAPTFSDGESTTREVVENTGSNINIGSGVAAMDTDDNDTLEYTLGGLDAASFEINATNGQLITKAPLDHETKDTYTVTVTATDSEGLTAEITVAIAVLNDPSDDPRPPTPDPTPVNNAPTFSDGESTTREMVENTGSNINIGSAVAAMDTDDNDTLEYTLGGLDAASFEINATNGQLITKAPLDHETKDTYTVTVTATDQGGLSAEIMVTVTVTDVAEYLLTVPQGFSLIHIPLKVTAVAGVLMSIETVGDLYDALGGAATVNLLITYDATTQQWLSYLGDQSRGKPSDAPVTDTLGILAVMKNAVTVSLAGDPLGVDGSSSMTLHPGLNLVGVPLMDSRLTRVSDLFVLEGVVGNVTVIITWDGVFRVVAQPGDPGDIPITGGQAFILIARQMDTVPLTGDGV